MSYSLANIIQIIKNIQAWKSQYLDKQYLSKYM